jgi:hypothetical protein
MDAKYVSRTVPLTQDKLQVLEQYRTALQTVLGFKVSLSDAIVHAVKTANKHLGRTETLES